MPAPQLRPPLVGILLRFAAQGARFTGEFLRFGHGESILSLDQLPQRSMIVVRLSRGEKHDLDRQIVLFRLPDVRVILRKLLEGDGRATQHARHVGGGR